MVREENEENIKKQIVKKIVKRQVEHLWIYIHFLDHRNYRFVVMDKYRVIDS